LSDGRQTTIGQAFAFLLKPDSRSLPNGHPGLLAIQFTEGGTAQDQDGTNHLKPGQLLMKEDG
jgi:hypothetical protein